MEGWNTLLIPIITIILGWFTFWIRNSLTQRQKEKSLIIENKRNIFQGMLDLHSEKLVGKHLDDSSWIERMGKISSQFIVWVSDEVVHEYATYLENKNTEEFNKLEDYEIQFGKMILEFRKEIGYTNKRKLLMPKHLTLIFKSGWKKTL